MAGWLPAVADAAGARHRVRPRSSAPFAVPDDGVTAPAAARRVRHQLVGSQGKLPQRGPPFEGKPPRRGPSGKETSPEGTLWEGNLPGGDPGRKPPRRGPWTETSPEGTLEGS